MSTLEAVRETCARVAEVAEHVHINRDVMPEYVEKVAAATPITGLDPDFHYLQGSDEDKATFVIVLDTINFGSGWFPVINKGQASSGYFKIAGSLKEWFRRYGVPTATRLRSLTREECCAIFGQQGNSKAIDLMQLFASALNDLGDEIEQHFEGSFAALVEAANGSADALVDLLSAMPLFADMAMYKGDKIFFYKRAQITASDLDLAFGGEGLGAFTDIYTLTCFADNLVPHVLRADGVLSYTSKLLQRINREELIPAGSQEEIEIRACAVTAVEWISECSGQAGAALPPRLIDNILWEKGQGPAYKAHPRHRTLTTFY